MEHKSLCKNLSSYSILKLVANKFLNNFKTIHWIGRKSLIKQFKPTCRVRIGQKILLICISIYIYIYSIIKIKVKYTFSP